MQAGTHVRSRMHPYTSFGIRLFLYVVGVAVIEDYLEHPVGGFELSKGNVGLANAGQVDVKKQRLAVSVMNAFEIAVGGTATVALVGPIQVDANFVVGDVLV